jgi:hypothetical protein
MKRKQLISILMFSCLFVATIQANADSGSGVIEWSKPMEAKFHQILSIKEEAMKLPMMRSQDGTLGKKAEAVMDQIAEEITDPSMASKLRDNEGTDIRAKIALWAVDRKARPDEYKRFAKYYVNSPTNHKDAVEYFYRLHEKDTASQFDLDGNKEKPDYYVPRPGAWEPNPVDKEDQIEANRLVIEYCYFMPPCGESFDRDYSSGHISNALQHVGNYSKSLIVWKVDGDIALQAIAHNEKMEFPPRSASSFVALSQIATPESFIALSDFWRSIPSREVVRKSFERNWGETYISEPFSLGKFTAMKKKYDAWMALAKQSWEKPAEQEFAKWLLTQPPPKQPAPPLPAKPGDPFGGP